MATTEQIQNKISDLRYRYSVAVKSRDTVLTKQRFTRLVSEIPGLLDMLEDLARERDNMVEKAPACEFRGWYHDGSEREEALMLGREPRKCPHCGARAK